MHVAGLQFDLAWEQPERNLARIRDWLPVVAARGARMLFLPEMFAWGFSMATDRIAEPREGPSTTFLRESARAHGLWLGGSAPIAATRDGRPHNSFVLAGPDGQLHVYRKMFPFTFAREHEAYAAGDAPLTVAVEGVRFSLFVCYDLRFADVFWRLAPETDCYVVVANWPEQRRHHWTTLLRARAIENQAYVIGINRVGAGNGIEYRGDSMIVDPWGEILASAAGDESLLFADVDPTRVVHAREHFPVLRDRR